MIEFPESLATALQLATDQTPLVRDTLALLCVHESTEVYLRDIIDRGHAASPGLLLWYLVLLAWIGATPHTWWDAAAAERAREVCGLYLLDPQAHLAALRHIWQRPVPRGTAPLGGTGLCITPALLMQPEPQIIQEIAHRAASFLRDHVLLFAGVDMATVFKPSPTDPDVHLFFIAMAAHAWHTERNYDHGRTGIGEHVIDEADIFIEPVPYHTVPHRPPRFSPPEDTSASITLASVMINHAAAAYYGTGESPFNMIGAVEAMRRTVFRFIV